VNVILAENKYFYHRIFSRTVKLFFGTTNEERLQKILFFLVVSISLLVSGARLASSDENAIYLLTESIVTRGAFDIPPNIIDNGSFFENKFFIWAEIGEALLAIPFFLAGKILSFILPVSEPMKLLVVKAIVSSMNAFFGAALAVVFFRLCRKFSFSVRTALFLTLTLCFGTFLFPYVKTISRDVQLAFFLCASFYCLYSYKNEKEHSTHKTQRWILYAGIFAGFGFLTKMIFLLNISFLALYLFFISRSEKNTRAWLKHIFWFSFPIAIAFGIFFLYNVLRFRNILETGYHGGTTFPTPLYYGLYGLLFSSGKGIFIFAPITVLLLWATKKFFKKFRNEAFVIFSLLAANIFLFAKYVAWAGDGSWGPRYLVSVLPLIILPLGIFLDESSKTIKRIAVALSVIGFCFQLGGVSIYFGNYLRSIGEFPYEKNFEHPEFLMKSHFNPYYSPIVGHWRMMKKNCADHIEGKIPLITIAAETHQQRIPIAKEDLSKMQHTLDFWFTYGMYLGYSPNILLAIFFVAFISVLVQIFLLHRAVHYAHVDSLLQINGATQ